MIPTRERVAEVRRRLAEEGPPWTRDRDGDFETVVDPFQESAWQNVGWRLLESAGLAGIARLVVEPSSRALPRLAEDGFVADAAFVDGNHRFHEVFVDLYFLRRIVRPGGLVVLDDCHWPSVGTAARYYETNLGWRPLDGAAGQRLRALRLPDPPTEPPFEAFTPFR